MFVLFIPFMRIRKVGKNAYCHRYVRLCIRPPRAAPIEQIFREM